MFTVYDLLWIVPVSLGCTLILGVATGNVTSAKLLLKLGVPVLLGNPLKDYRVFSSRNKDCIGWIKVPDVCYAPIMYGEGEVYKDKTSSERYSDHSELLLVRGKNALESIGFGGDDLVFQDMATISGSASVRSSSVRNAKFTFLRKYINSELQRYHPNITLIDKGKQRNFSVAFAVDIEIENRRSIQFTDRSTFIESMREMACFDTGKALDSHVVILSAKTDIDNLLLFLVEV